MLTVYSKLEFVLVKTDYRRRYLKVTNSACHSSKNSRINFKTKDNIVDGQPWMWQTVLCCIPGVLEFNSSPTDTLFYGLKPNSLTVCRKKWLNNYQCTDICGTYFTYLDSLTSTTYYFHCFKNLHLLMCPTTCQLKMKHCLFHIDNLTVYCENYGWAIV